MTDYLDALQTTLAAEHAALFVTGYLGAQTSESGDPSLFAAVSASYAAHRARRDDLVAGIRGLGGTPVPAEPAYDLPEVGQDPRAVAAAALQVEQRCARTYHYLVGHSPSAQRQYAVDLLVDAAVRELAFGGRPQTFPGR